MRRCISEKVCVQMDYGVSMGFHTAITTPVKKKTTSAVLRSFKASMTSKRETSIQHSGKFLMLAFSLEYIYNESTALFPSIYLGSPGHDERHFRYILASPVEFRNGFKFDGICGLFCAAMVTFRTSSVRQCASLVSTNHRYQFTLTRSLNTIRWRARTHSITTWASNLIVYFLNSRHTAKGILKHQVDVRSYRRLLRSRKNARAAKNRPRNIRMGRK